MSEMQYRHEFKYVISSAQVPMIQNRVEHMLMRDVHAGPAGCYNIRSLYFDDWTDRCYHENENGTDPREKFRIRIYNHSTGQIKLECKRKQQGKTYKASCPLTIAQTQALMAGKILPDIASQPPLLQKLTVKMMTRRMRPVVIVEYDRVPYVYKGGNVRVTLDTNIASCKDVSRFLDETIPKRPVMPIGQQLLEVKYDEYLPDFIRRNLQLENLQQTAFSKYYLCRKYTR
ncbi:MAG: polyphosphate polymerase domain-containing protein [Clostridia bacterium]|nr:polyphosphate polymerase domain-containing protein [Clostridia bacterium]